jgi:hypothetical protein
MTDISLEDHELICRYLARRLTEAEELMLESRIVEDPVFRNEVELTAALKDGMHELEGRGEVSRLLTGDGGSRRRLHIALAASLGAFTLGLVSFLFYQQREELAPAAVTETLNFEQTRGSGAQADVAWERSSAPTQLEMRFDVGPEPAAAYQVTISRTDDDAAEATVGLEIATSSDGEVVLSIDGALLEQGDYEIRLEPRPATALAETVTYSLAVN